MKYNLDNIGKKDETIRKVIYKCFSILIYLLVFIILLYLLFSRVTTLKVYGYEAFVIVSESMEPKINTGDIVIIKKVPENNIKEGDIITFEKNKEYITHRIVKIEKDNGQNLYTTKGDNNTVNDTDKIEYSQIKGIQIGKIPFVGTLVLKVANQKNIIIILIIILLLYNRAKKIDEKRKGRRKKKKIEDERYFKNQSNQ